MNLGQCIPAEWAQERMPVRHEPVPPPGWRPEPTVRRSRDSNGLPVPVAAEPRQDRESVEVETPPQQQPPRGDRSRFWPRGRAGSRYKVLEWLGRQSSPRRLAEIHEAAGEANAKLTQQTLMILMRQKLIRREGSMTRYAYEPTALGRRALEE